MITSEELHELMSYCTGTEEYHKYSLFGKGLLLTDGALLFANKAGAFWFIDEILIRLNKLVKKFPNESFFSIKLKSKNNKATIIFSDGEGNKTRANIKFTDCPEGEYNFYLDLESKVLLLQSEY